MGQRQSVSGENRSVPSILLESGGRVAATFYLTINKIDYPVLGYTVFCIYFPFPTPVIGQARFGNLDHKENLVCLRMFAFVIIRVGTTQDNIRFRLTQIVKDERKLSA
jgi:hypothetical protein